MIAEWDVPFTLITPEGELDFNQTDTSGRRYQLDPHKCSSLLPVRSTDDDMPQHDGKIPHRRWRSGYGVHLAIEFMVGDGDEKDCASGSELVAMADHLGLHLNSMIRTGLVGGFPNARLSWEPTDSIDCRMLDRLQLAGAPTPSLDGALGGMLVEVDLDTPYPYYISCTEEDTPLSVGTDVATLHNSGNTDHYPVIEVAGPAAYFEIINESIVDYDGNPLNIIYDSALPGAVAIGGGDTLEINNFLGIAFLNSDGANRLAGIDMRSSEFFPIIPGDNVITIVGTAAVIKWNHAWA